MLLQRYAIMILPTIHRVTLVSDTDSWQLWIPVIPKWIAISVSRVAGDFPSSRRAGYHCETIVERRKSRWRNTSLANNLDSKDMTRSQPNDVSARYCPAQRWQSFFDCMDKFYLFSPISLLFSKDEIYTLPLQLCIDHIQIYAHSVRLRRHPYVYPLRRVERILHSMAVSWARLFRKNETYWILLDQQ